MSSPGVGDIFRAYQGVEELAHFDATGLRAYREDLLRRSAEQIAFIADLLNQDADVLELATGNGRLLIGLSREASIRRGIGIDIARSRVEFAAAWAREEQAHQLDFAVSNALTHPLPRSLDAAICITGAFAYFDAIRAGAGVELLRRIHAVMRPGGSLVLELYPHPVWRRQLDIVPGGELRIWQELSEPDPWRFYLSHVSLSRSNEMLTHSKTFIHRDAGKIDDARREHLRLYTLESIRAEIIAANFAEPELYGDWSRGPATDSSEILIAVSRRP
jgi:SAM-dependent methyltransferase